MSNYDSWLEAPYQRAYEEADRFADWAEEQGFDLADPDECRRAEEEYDAWLLDMAESWAEEQYERYMESKWDQEYEDDRWEGCYDYDHEYDY